MIRVVVLGATGFVGRNMAEAFAADPACEVVGIHHNRPAFSHPKIRWVAADLTTEAGVAAALDGATIVIHAAAATAGSAANLGDPLSMIVDNQIMNSRVFAAANRLGVRHVVWFSCSVMYRSSPQPQREEDYDPRDEVHPAYAGVAITKVYFENMCAWHAAHGRTRFTALRHSNVYGPHDKYDLARSHVFGATVTKALTAEDGRLTLWGTGHAARDLIHVDDLCAAVKAIVTGQNRPYALYNVGAGAAVTTRELAERIVRASGRALDIVLDPGRPTIDTELSLDSSRIRDELGWRPRVGLDEGIARTIAWWRASRPLGTAPAR
jgi:nucleoside-diphosphate-sugar epimerase